MPEIACNFSDCFFCGSCIPEWEKAIAIKKRIIRFKKGRQIFTEGDKVKGIYFLSPGHMEVRERTADALFEIARFYGYDKDKFIAASVTRQDISSYDETACKTAFGFFAEPVRKKIISALGKNIRINKPADLRKYFVTQYQ